jgi:D-methionine transport system substrate-binding protein
VLALVLACSFVGCKTETPEPTEPAEPETTPQVVKIGVIGENNEYWQPVADALAEEGVVLEFVPFSDYAIPNRALNDGDIDLNSFQHYIFLETEIANQGYDITPIGETILAPLSLYSDKIESLDEITDGSKIAIASDASNGGRALKLLEQLGFIKIDPAKGYIPALTDVTEYIVDIEIVELEANMIPAALPDLTAGFINGAIAIDAGLKPFEDALFMETQSGGSDNPFINVIVARTEDKDNELYLRICELFQTEAVAQILIDEYGGAMIPAFGDFV